jgi:hypothetical protein
MSPHSVSSKIHTWVCHLMSGSSVVTKCESVMDLCYLVRIQYLDHILSFNNQCGNRLVMNFHAALWSRGYGSLQKWIQTQSSWGAVSVRASGIQVLNPASVPRTAHQGTRSINIIHTPEIPWAYYETSGLTMKSPHCDVFLTVIHGNVFRSFSNISLLSLTLKMKNLPFTDALPSLV